MKNEQTTIPQRAPRRPRPGSSTPNDQHPGSWPWVIVGISALALLWTYWQTIVDLFKDWQRDENYSVGQLVPLAALYLLWQDRTAIRRCVFQPFWGGVGLLILAQVLRFGGLMFLFESAERYSLILTVAGMVLLIGGTRFFRQTAWVLLFLFLMVPLPGKVHNLLSGPLQNLATAGAVFTLELAGVTVAREGNIILLNHSVPLAVAEACSGLRMLTAFVVVAATLAYVVNRPRWQKAVLVISSVPVAILCNLARLVVTAQLYLVADSKTAERFFHDFAGFTMMPLAVLILVIELYIMDKLIVPDDPADRGSETVRETK